MKRKAIVQIAMAFLCTLLFAFSCTNKPVAFDYCSTAVEGWEPGDSLKFHIDTLQQSGQYKLSIGVRTSSSNPYPYQTLWLVVRQHWHNPSQELIDTIHLQLANGRGDPQGHGVTLYQYDYPWQTLQLQASQSADISIIHIMRREMLPGISNVGIQLNKL